MATGALSVTVAVQLDGSGNGTASAGPQSAREVWHVTSVAVSVNITTAEATCAVYAGDAAQPRNLKGTTFTGSSGDATGMVTGDVKVGQKVFAVWTGGTPLAMATMLITGTKSI